MKIWVVEEYDVEKGETALKHNNIWYLASEELVFSFLVKRSACHYLSYDIPVRLGDIDGFFFVRPEEKVDVCGMEIVQPELRYEVRTVEVIEHV